MNTFGDQIRITLLGESHGAGVGVVMDGLPAALPLSEADFDADLSRRRSGFRGTTPRHEGDRVQILAGFYEGHTTGAPLLLWIPNEQQHSADYDSLKSHYRPSHADWVAAQRYGGMNDPRGGGRFSGRLTAPLVAAGVVAKRLLPGVSFETSLVELGGERSADRFETLLQEALQTGDSLGGVVECRIQGAEVGWGEPWFDSVESRLAHLLFSIPGVKGVEFGAGFGAARMRGSEHNDPILNSRGETLTNHAGGVVGGLTNGNPITLRVAFKPTASIAREQMTYNASTDRVEPLRIEGRHDTCIALRGAVVVEAAVALVLADLKRCAAR